MRIKTKNKLLDIINTIFDAHDEIIDLIKNQDIELASKLIGECQDIIINVGEVIQGIEGDNFITLNFIEEYCKVLFDIYNSLSAELNYNQIRENLFNSLSGIEESVRKDIYAKTEIVFLPYKSSMWDSMESIWKAANEDPKCIVYVIPIPYYDRKPDHSFGTFHYEGSDFPSNVSVTDYRKYDFSKNRPDIIYIHSPYDEYNFVTSVEPFFYSHNLKKYTDMLVYVPYFIDGFYNNKDSIASMLNTSAARNVNYIVVQSEIQKSLYKYIGISSEKLLVLGNPKTDAVLMHRSDCEIPESWRKTINNKKVILVNSTIASFLSIYNYIEKYTLIIEELLSFDRYAIIWRPHPLLEATIKSMRPDTWQYYVEMKDNFMSYDNFILDDTKDSMISIMCSDILISDYSSIVFSYLITQKPVISIVNDDPFDDSNIYVFDYRKNYFFNIDDNNGILKLVDNIFEKNDPLKKDRMELVKKSLENCDGTCGSKVHKSIKSLLQKDEYILK